jgi:rhodanese-related sulfurtransferase
MFLICRNQQWRVSRPFRLRIFKKVIESDNEFVLLDIRSEDEFNAAHHCCNSFIPHGCSNNMSIRGEFQVNKRGGRGRTNI